MKLGWGVLAAVLLGVFLSVSVQAAVLECDSCESCNAQIAAAADGDTVQLTTSISNYAGTDWAGCINFGGMDGVTFDCLGNTIDGEDSGLDLGIWLNESGDGSNGNTIRNCTVTDFYIGVFLRSSSNNLLTNIRAASNVEGIVQTYGSGDKYTNITANSNIGSGFDIQLASNNMLTDAICNSNYYGVTLQFGSFYNILTNVTARSNIEGILLRAITTYPDVMYNVINNSRIENNTHGVFLMSGPGESYIRYNTFYNNYLNNSVNFYSENDSNINYWNSSRDCTKANIMGYPCIGGNYWTSPNGNFSDACADSNQDMICDSGYVLDPGNADYMPLTSDRIPPNISLVPPTPANGTNATGNYVEVNVSLSEVPNACILSWYNGTWTNYTMTISGLYCYLNMTGLLNYTYQFRVYANDTEGNMNVSEARQVGVSYSLPDTIPPTLIILAPANNTQTNQSWVFINASAGELLGSCILSWNGVSNETFFPSGSSCSINKTSLAEGTYTFRMYASDLSGNWNSTETRYLTVNFSLPYVTDYISISYGISPVLLKTGSNTTISVNVATNGTLDRIVVRITPPGSATVMFVFTGNTTFNYTPSLPGVYNISVFANTTRGYNQSVGDNFTGVDCMGNETMECGMGIGECRKGNLTCQNGTWATNCTGAVWPATETCNQKDDDCNGIIDNVNNGTSVESSQCQCYNGGTPLASESCNGIDDNCNGIIDDNSDCCTNGQTRACGIDTGACEFGISSCSGGVWGSCTGGIGVVSEVCGNNLDDDCDGQTDEYCTVCTDADGDGYGNPASNTCTHPQLDCNDGDRNMNPGTLEICDSKDNNCNGKTDEDVSCSTCTNGVMDGTETGVDCGGDCTPCPDNTIFWISLSVTGAVIFGVFLFLYFKFRKQGRELTWEELFRKWTPAPP